MTDHFKETFKRRKEVLLPSLERHVLREAARPDGRRSDVLHPSEMSKGSWCHRHDYYRITGRAPDFASKQTSFRMEQVYNYGHTAHRKYQTWLWEMGLLWGKWHCELCEIEWIDTAPQKCPKCGSRRFLSYMEVPLGYGLLGGHADGGLIFPDFNALLEIKTIGLGSLPFDAPRLHEEAEEKQLTPDEIWFRINRPFASHQRQGQLYLYLAHKLYPELAFDRIIFTYEWKVTQGVKEFVVKRNPAFIDSILDKVYDVEKAIKQGEPPERPESLKPDGKVCRGCEYRATCWGTKAEPPGPRIRVRKVKSSDRRKALRPGA